MTRIRQMRPADAERFPAIERSAAEAFRALPDLAWIAGQEVDTVGDRLHVWELSVQQASQRQGLGRALMDHATRFARDRGLAALTLTTFRDVLWNGPFYGRLGFEEVAPQDLSSDLAQILAHEVARGLPGDRRCAMRLALSRS